MIRLLRIELHKITTYRAFWSMVGVYSIILAFLIFGIPAIIDYIGSRSSDPMMFKLFKAVVFHFPDVWQNTAFVASARYFVKIILGIIIIILVTNEFQFNTIRANVISGLSKSDFFWGKMTVILLLTVFSTVIVFLSGIYLGFKHSVETEIFQVFNKMTFLAGYFLELATYLIFCMLLAIVFKKTGVTFIAHMVYLFIEPIIDYKIPDPYSDLLPLNAMNNIIQSPNSSLIQVKSDAFLFNFQEFISIADVGICLCYALLFSMISMLILNKKDI
jgi:ABC-2 type transport system permease protein